MSNEIIVPDDYYYAQVHATKQYALGVINGNTVDFTIDCGFGNYRNERIRLWGVDCPEVTDTTSEASLEVINFVKRWLLNEMKVFVKSNPVCRTAYPFILHTQKDDAFGRYNAKVYGRGTGIELRQHLLYQGHAAPYDTK